MIRLRLSAAALLLAGSACAPAANGVKATRPAFWKCGAVPAHPLTAGFIAVSSAGDGSVSLVDRNSLATVRVVPAPNAGRAESAMSVVDDPRRGAFYAGNFGGGLGRIPIDPAAQPAQLDMGGTLAGLAVSPDGCLLAAVGTRDLVTRIVDLQTFTVVARATLGLATDSPKHGALTHGMASTYPVWLPDGSAVLVEDNIHEELVLVARDGRVLGRRPVRSPVHSILIAAEGQAKVPMALALTEGSADGSIAPSVVVLSLPSLDVEREMEVVLPRSETPKLHHGALSPDGNELVVANMGSPRDGDPTTVTAFRWKTGERLWGTSGVPTGGHVAFVGADRVVVAGHRAAELVFVDAATGARADSWEILGAGTLGHSLLVGTNGSVTILDGALGRVLRFKGGEPEAESERLGDGNADSSLPQ